MNPHHVPGHSAEFRRLAGLACMAATAWALVACQTTAVDSRATGDGSAKSDADAGAAPQRGPLPPGAALQAEARWLEQWFGDTPVEVRGDRDGSVRLEVPMKFAFDAAANPAVPRPPLQAVLDKVAVSMKRQPGARLQVAVPAPEAAERLEAIRGRLASQGVAPRRVAKWMGGATSLVVLRMTPPVTGLRELDDRQLPGAAGAVRPPSPPASGPKR